jgi:hypothetical protein
VLKLHGMQAMRLVHEDEESEIYEEEELEIFDEDIACSEPADGARPAVRMSYERINAFLGRYFGTIRRGGSMVVPAPHELGPGDLLDVEIAIANLDRFVLHAQVLSRWPLPESALAEVQFVSGRLTDRIVAPVAERALGTRLAGRMLRS